LEIKRKMYFLNVWIHILAAAVWTGGLIYTAAVVVPFALSSLLLHHSGSAFSRLRII